MNISVDSLLAPKTFLLIADLLPDPTLLISHKGTILAANRAFGRRTQLVPAQIAGSDLAALITMEPERLHSYLTSCSRTRELLPGALTLQIPGNEPLPCRAECGLLQPGDSPEEPSLLLLRLLPKQDKESQFSLLTQRINDLSREITARRRAEEEQKRSKELLSTTLRSIGDAVIATDRQGCITFINPVAEELTGWKEEQALGASSGLVFHVKNERTGITIESPIDRVLRDQMIVSLENHTVLLSRTGHRIPIDDSGAPIMAPNGELLGAVLVFRDITESRKNREALRQSEEKFRLALANSGIIVYMQNLELQYTWIYNGAKSAEETGYYGFSDYQLIAPDEAAQMTEIKRRVIATGQEERHIVQATFRGDPTRYLDTNFAPLRDDNGHIIGVTGTINDITERKRAADALAHHQAEIEDLNTRLRRSMRETHHRVKNNLQVITAMINLQQLQHQDQVPTSELQRLTQHIKALASIHDLLTHQAQADAELNEIPVQAVMDRLISSLQEILEIRDLQYQVDAFWLPIRQSTTLAVLVNELVSNATKHGTGTIAVYLRQIDELIRLEVIDSGPGFPQDFDSLQAANTGLDLISSLVHIDLHGHVRYENQQGGGACVVVEFPAPAFNPLSPPVRSSENSTL